MTSRVIYAGVGVTVVAAIGWAVSTVWAQKSGEKQTSYAPVAIIEGFTSTMARMKTAKSEVMRRQRTLLEERYDLSDRPAKGVTMSRGKPIQEGVRVKLPSGIT